MLFKGMHACMKQATHFFCHVIGESLVGHNVKVKPHFWSVMQWHCIWASAGVSKCVTLQQDTISPKKHALPVMPNKHNLVRVCLFSLTFMFSVPPRNSVFPQIMRGKSLCSRWKVFDFLLHLFQDFKTCIYLY